MSKSFKNKEFWHAAKFMTGAIFVIGGGSYLGFKLADYFPSKKPGLTDPNLRLQGDGLAEYRINDQTSIWITEEEVDLRYQKIRLENEILSLKEKIRDMQQKIDNIRTRSLILSPVQANYQLPPRNKN